MTIITHQGVSTRYHLNSLGPEPWLTFIHPLGADLSIWDQLSARFANHYQVLRYDLRGHGHTNGATAFSVEDLATDLLSLHDALGIMHSHIVGLSLGGMVAQAFALAHPARVHGLVLCDTTPGTPAEERAPLLQRAATAREKGMAALVDQTMERWFTADFRENHPEALEQIKEVLAANQPEAYALACEAIAHFDVRNRLGRISAPTLIVAGEQDAGMPLPLVQFMAQAIPHAQTRIMPGAHLAAIQSPGDFAEYLEGFLRALPDLT